MAWEQRGNQRYYYRSQKIDGRVIKTYIGGGLAGRLAEQEDETRRCNRAAGRAALREDKAAFDVAAATYGAISEVADAMMASALLAAGFHRHDRGHWRKRRAS